MRIRLADHRDPGDLEVVLRLRLAFVADVRGVDVATFEPAFVDATRAYLERVTAEDRLTTWLAEDDDGRSVGIASVLHNDAPPLPEEFLTRDGYLINVWVAPAARRRGVARALVDSAVDAAPSLGMRGLHLFATAAGRPLYEDAGFVPNPTWMERRNR